MWKSDTQSLAIPYFMYSDECEVSKLVKLQNEVREAFQCQALISRALLEYPELNAWVNDKSESLDIKKEHNISLTMDTPGGLVVPNMKNVQQFSVVGIAKELNRLQALGRESSISLADLTDGTFSISNVGIVGDTYTKPAILSPKS